MDKLKSIVSALLLLAVLLQLAALSSCARRPTYQGFHGPPYLNPRSPHNKI